MIRQLHLTSTTGHRLLYLDNRLKYCQTFLEWDKRVLGPIHDEVGLEQGGVSSGEHYVANRSENLEGAQDSNLGVPFHAAGVTVAYIGVAHDVTLISHDIHFLKNLLQLTLDYCKKFHVIIAPEKTKLLCLS